MLDRATHDWGEHVRQAEAWLQDQDVGTLAGGTPLSWVMESHRLAANAYDIPSDLNMAEAYHDKALPIASAAGQGRCTLGELADAGTWPANGVP